MIILECCPPFQPKPIYRKFGPGHWRIIWLWFGLAYIRYGLPEYVEKVAKAAVSLHIKDSQQTTYLMSKDSERW